MTSDPLSRFYSRALVGDVLAAILPPLAGGTVLDLCSGTGRLNAPFATAWPEVRLVTADADPDAPPTSWPEGRAVHVRADALSLRPGDGIVPPGGFDAVLCNPPYGPMVPSAGERAILPWAASTARGSVDAASVFAAQALRLTAPGGTAALVLPDGLVTGRRYRDFRTALAREHGILDVVQLPAGAFDGTGARAFVVVLRRDRPGTAPIRLRSADASGALGPAVGLLPSRAGERLDHAYHATMAGAPQGATLRDLGAEVVRGRIAPGQAGPGGIPVFHTGDFPVGEARRRHALPDATPGTGGEVLAGPGDILIARVHRSLHRKVCLVDSGQAAPTTFVLRVRVPPLERDRVVSALISDAGEERLRATARGVGSRMIGQEDLLGMPLP